MVLTKRERYIGIITGVVLGVLVLDYFIVTPLLAQMAVLDAKITSARNDVKRSNDLLDLSSRAKQRWNEMSSGAVRDSEQADQIVNNVSDWAREAGVLAHGASQAEIIGIHHLAVDLDLLAFQSNIR